MLSRKVLFLFTLLVIVTWWTKSKESEKFVKYEGTYCKFLSAILQIWKVGSCDRNWAAVVWESQSEWFSKGYQWIIGHLFFLTTLLNTQMDIVYTCIFDECRVLKLSIRSRAIYNGLFVRHIWSWPNTSVSQLLSSSRCLCELGGEFIAFITSLAPWLYWDLSVTKQGAFGAGECSLVIAQFSVTVWCAGSVPENNFSISGVHQNSLLTANFQYLRWKSQGIQAGFRCIPMML